PLSVVMSATVFAETRKLRRSTPLRDMRLMAFGDPKYPTTPNDASERGPNPALDAASSGLALPPIPETRHEIETVAALFPNAAEVFLGDQATEERVKTIGTRARLVHFACHGILDEHLPLNSALALTVPERQGEGADNGLLQAWEIFDSLRLDADLV